MLNVKNVNETASLREVECHFFVARFEWLTTSESCGQQAVSALLRAVTKVYFFLDMGGVAALEPWLCLTRPLDSWV